MELSANVDVCFVSNSGNYRDFCQLPGSIMVGNYSRVKESVLLSINIQPFSLADFCGYSNFAKPIVAILPDPLVIDQTPEALRWVLRLRQLLPFNLLVRPIFKQQEKHKSVAFDVKQTRILPNSVSADSTKFFRYF
jgi:hypothetical protein